MRAFPLVIAAVAFLLNPNVACSSVNSEPEFDYGEGEMKSAVEGTWQAQLSDGTESASFRFTLTQASRSAQATRATARPWLRSAFACGDREFVKSAAACIDSSSLPVAVTYLDGDKQLGARNLWSTSSAPSKGVFSVMSLKFTSGTLSFALNDVEVEANVAPDGFVTDVHSYSTSPNRMLTDVQVTLTRLEK